MFGLASLCLAIHDFVFAGWDESARGIVHHYGADRAWLDAHMQDLYRRFQNRALGDTIFRLGRDPVRKLAPTDRLVAPANLAIEAGVTPTNLARGIAAAFCFAAPDDPVAVELQQRLRSEGLPALLQSICQVPPDGALGRLVQEQYAALRAEFAARFGR